MTALFMTLMLGLATADDTTQPQPDDADQSTPDQMPLAIPLDRQPPPNQDRVVGESVSLRRDGPGRIEALQQYKRDRFYLGSSVTLHRGSGHSGFTWGSRRGWRWGVSLYEPIYSTTTWGVYRGYTLTEVPAFLGAVGEDALREQLLTDIRTAQRSARKWHTVGWVGVAGLIAGIIGAETSKDRKEYEGYSGVSSVGLIMAVGGFVGGSLPAARAARLRRSPTASIGMDTAQQLADEHNDRLRSSLGLTEGDVWTLESQSPR